MWGMYFQKWSHQAKRALRLVTLGSVAHMARVTHPSFIMKPRFSHRKHEAYLSTLFSVLRLGFINSYSILHLKVNVCYRKSLLRETKSRRKNQAFDHASNNKILLNLFNLKILFCFDSVICQFPKEKVERKLLGLFQ